MPNWCSTSYRIEGNQETLEKIYNAILHHDVIKGSDANWEGNILMALGLTWKDKTPDGNGKYMRGFIKEKPSIRENTLEFYAEEAWGVTDFGEVLEENFPDIKVYFCGEEPDCEYYITNDEEGIYFPDRYILDVCINNTYWYEYFKTEKSLFDFLSNISECKTYEDIEAFNSNREGTDSEDYICIYPFKVIKDEEKDATKD